MNGIILFIVLVSIQCVAGGAMRSDAELRDSVIVVSANPGELRSFEADWYPSEHPRYINLTGIDIKAEGNNTYEGNAVQFTLNSFNQSTLTFAYYDAHVSGSTENVAAFEFIFRSIYVFEYTEGNNISGYQNGTADTITGYYDLSHPDLVWKDLVISSKNVTVDGIELSVWFVTAETADSVFLVRFVVAGANVEVERVKLTPTTCKIDVDIKWFTNDHIKANWTTGPSPIEIAPNARVGLISILAAEAETFTANTSSPLNNSNPTFTFESAGAVGYFSYESQADVVVQGVEASHAVHASVDSESSGTSVAAEYSAEYLFRVMWFSFDGIRPSEVSWDPEFGASLNTTSSKPASTTSATHTSATTSAHTPSGTTQSANASSSSYFVPSVLCVVVCALFAWI